MTSEIGAFNWTEIADNFRNMDGNVTFWFVFVLVFIVIAVIIVLYLARDLCCYVCYCLRAIVKKARKRHLRNKSARKNKKSNSGQDGRDSQSNSDNAESVLMSDDSTNNQDSEVGTKRKAWAAMMAVFKRITCEGRPNSVVEIEGNNVSL